MPVIFVRSFVEFFEILGMKGLSVCDQSHLFLWDLTVIIKVGMKFIAFMSLIIVIIAEYQSTYISLVFLR